MLKQGGHALPAQEKPDIPTELNSGDMPFSLVAHTEKKNCFPGRSRRTMFSLHKKFTELSLDSHVHMINRTFQTSVREIDSQNDKCVHAFRSLQFTKK